MKIMLQIIFEWIDNHFRQPINDHNDHQIEQPTQYIPEEIVYHGWQRDKNDKGQTALMYWIINCQPYELPNDKRDVITYPPLKYNYDIPKEFTYFGQEKDRDQNGYTPLMLWIRYRQKGNIPKELFYPNWIYDQTKDGLSIIRLWAIGHGGWFRSSDQMKMPDELAELVKTRPHLNMQQASELDIQALEIMILHRLLLRVGNVY